MNTFIRNISFCIAVAIGYASVVLAQEPAKLGRPLQLPEFSEIRGDVQVQYQQPPAQPVGQLPDAASPQSGGQDPQQKTIAPSSQPQGAQAIWAQLRSGVQAPSGTDLEQCRRCRPRCWVSAEYLLWWLKDGDTPPLVSTGDPADTFPGALDQPGTRVLFGGDGALDYGGLSGIRLNVGSWLDECWGVEFSGFLFEQGSVDFHATSDAAGNPPLYIPIINYAPSQPPTPHEGSYTNGDGPFGFGPGFVTTQAQTRLWSAEINALRKLRSDPCCSANLIAGFRYLGLDESLRQFGDSLDNQTPLLEHHNDVFTTHNQFYGGQIGGQVILVRGCWALDLTGKVALGAAHQVVSVSGGSTFTGGGLANPLFTPDSSDFTQPTNAGRQEKDVFAVVPQVQIKLRYRFNEMISASLGYDFIYWSSVVRAGDQIDRRINVDQRDPITGGTASLNGGEPFPGRFFGDSGFWAHGLSAGLELRY